ncbi:Three-prime repair exonuclease 1 isoform 1 [Schistosoma japonicum]|uniref:Three-prime repair exonuclease 1 isoform 1 n=1 Tax=Schistosoma japonicum TaxID=6182 RepID=A0A4Z2CT60_SCHJA|nr:Three-prime repair exonuclease 1 isoform 1 [Schistosoma japonicum]
MHITASSKLAGLNSDNLFHQKDFDSSAVDLIQLFLNRLDSPVCFVAHNGLRFDFPLLRAQIMSVKGNDYKLNDSTNAPIICTDTLHLFREFASHLAGPNSDDSGFVSTDDQSSNPVPISHSSPIKLSTTTNKHSFHLGDIHERVFGEKHIHAHTAEGDCRAMLRLIQYLGSPAIDWLQSHYVNFNSLTPMYSFHTPGISRISSLFPYQRTKVCSNISLSDTTSQLDNLQLE